MNQKSLKMMIDETFIKHVAKIIENSLKLMKRELISEFYHRLQQHFSVTFLWQYDFCLSLFFNRISINYAKLHMFSIDKISDLTW